MKKVKKLTALLLALTFIATTALVGCGNKDKENTDNTAAATPTVAPADTSTDTAAATEAPVDTAPADPNALPRTETLYYGGIQWGAVNGWNPLSDGQNNGLGITQSAGGSRCVMFETLYMYNPLDNKHYPLLADGDYQWNASLTEMTVKLKTAAHWNDGTPVTADDVAYTWETDKKIANARGTGYSPYVDTIEVVDPSTIVIKAVLTADGKAVNPLQVVAFVGDIYVLQKAWIQSVEERNGGDAAAIKADTCSADGEVVVSSGPYTKYYADDQKVVFIRDNNYWGQDASMWGSLPVPKYICHTIYADNPATEVAFKAGEVDVDQQFIANIQDLWEKDGLPISTYIDQAPYGICANMPTAWFNMDIPELQNVNVRKAIAMAVDYDAINANAMTGQSPTFTQVPRSIMAPTDGEQATFDHDAVKDLQWAGNDIDGANKLLDDAGIVDTDGDGIRELDGVKLSFNACCPNGWTDWMAAMEIVAAAGKGIGIEITTEYPEWDVYQTVFTAAKQTDYDIFMVWTDSSSPTQPWGRLRNLMDPAYLGVDGNWSGNWGHYNNPRVAELIAAIPQETDAAKLKELYTEAVKIYLTDVPSFSLMYRPNLFHAVNESVWTGFPEQGDGNNIPPLVLTDGYSIAGLYKIKLVQ